MSIYDPKTHKILGWTFEMRFYWKPDRFYCEWTELAPNYFEARK